MRTFYQMGCFLTNHFNLFPGKDVVIGYRSRVLMSLEAFRGLAENSLDSWLFLSLIIFSV